MAKEFNKLFVFLMCLSLTMNVLEKPTHFQASYLAPASNITKRINLSQKSDTSLKDAIVGNFVLSLYSAALKDSNNYVRQCAEESLGGLSQALRGASAALHEQVLPLCRKAPESSDMSDAKIQEGAAESLGGLAQAFSGNVAALREKVLPLYRKALESSDLSDADAEVAGEAAESLGGLALAFSGNVAALRELWLPLYRKALNDSDVFAHIKVAKSLGGLAQALSGNVAALREFWLPLYHQALNDLMNLVREGAAESLGGLALALSGDVAALCKFWLPLYGQALISSDTHVRAGAAKSLGGLAQGVFPYLDSYFSAEPLDLAREFLSRESLRQDPSLAVMLGISLLTQGYPETLSSPTQTWDCVVSLLPSLKAMPPREHSYFSFLTRHALGRMGAKMENEEIEQVYRDYFHEEALPNWRNDPKHLLGFILLDFELTQWNLPKEYSTQIRALKRSPAYTELLPILEEFSKPEDPTFREAVIGFTNWSSDVSAKDKGPYWGNVQKVFEITSRNRFAFESLELWEEVVEVLNLHAKPSTNKTQSLQQAAAHLKSLIPEKVKEIFHIESEGEFSAFDEFDEKEIAVILYVARNPDADPDDEEEENPLNKEMVLYFNALIGERSKEENPLYQKLRLYFKARLEGKSKVEAILLTTHDSYIIAPELIRGRAFLSGINQAVRNRVIQWEDALRHLGELATDPSIVSPQLSLYSLLAEIPKNPDPTQVKTYLERLNAWMKDSQNIIPREKQDLLQTIADHLKNVGTFLAEEEQNPEVKPSQGPSVAPVQEVEIFLAIDPIEILHLGKPSLGLGGSYFIVENSRYQKPPEDFLSNHTEYLLPYIGVIYIRDPRNPAKPLARVRVGFDPERKIIFLLSPIQANAPYEFLPLVERFLLALAEANRAIAFIPQTLYENPSGAFSFRLKSADLSLAAIPLPLDSALTEHALSTWSQTVPGFLLTPLFFAEEPTAVNYSL